MNESTKRIVLAGGSGFLGQALASFFHERGFEVIVLTRCPKQASLAGRPVAWDARTLGPGKWNWTEPQRLLI